MCIYLEAPNTYTSKPNMHVDQYSKVASPGVNN